MKKNIISIIAVLTAATVLALPLFAATSAAISDGGFEEGIGNVYANDGQVILESSADMAHSGSKSLKNSGRSNEWGAAAWNVTDYIKSCGDGQYYCTFYVSGDFDGSIRATLHTTHESGDDAYRNIAVMTSFKSGEWTFVGADENGNALAIGRENWNIDYSEWDKEIKSDVKNATLYFWIEGNNNGTVYLDEVNFWGNSDTPVSFNPGTSDDMLAALSVLVAAVCAGAVILVKKH